MATICRAHDWGQTALGSVQGWPAALRIAGSLVVASPLPAVLLWGDDLLQLYSDGYLPLLGTRHPLSLGQPVRETWPDAWRGAAPTYERVRAGESVVVPQALRRIRSGTGTADAWFTEAYSPVRDEAGVVCGVLVTMFDTTPQVLAQRRAETATRAKADFLTVMSHELRTPLNAIGGYAELLELGVRGPITSGQRDDLSRIQQSQQQLLGVINAVLSYAKVEAGLLHYAVEDVPMDELLARCVALVAGDVRERRLVLEYQSCITRLAARADGEKVQQIVLNLLSNAIKFTEPGGHVTLDCAAEEDKRLIVRVTDTGCGIVAGDLECVFQPFVQVDAKMTRAYEGTGLGLAISREMARGMGGDLTVTSTAGEGSTFTLTLACGRHESVADSPGKREGESR
ncbi:MAG: sensor protein [Gemmatimonadetes bacterium]|nr:sensor protein [Gemmatimonadota bacterium]